MVVAGTSALIDGSGFEVVGVTAASARRMAQACRRWGARIRLRSISEIVSPTGRRARRCSLPYTGEDFRKTDVWAALPIVKR
jgi:ribonuclease VapC